MIKKGWLIGALMLTIGTVNAQGVYTGIGIGYGFSSPTDLLGTKTEIDNAGNTTESNIYGSFGAGLNSSINVGYMFGEHFGVDLGINYFLGSKVISSETNTPVGFSKVTSHSNQLRLIPSFVMSTGGKLSLYTRAGFIFPTIGVTISELRGDFMGSTTEQDFETKGAFTVGYHGAFGGKYNVNDHISLFAEISGAYLRIKSKTRTQTKSTSNGVDILDMMTTYQKEINYTDELNGNSNNYSINPNASGDSAREELATKSNYNGAFLNVGVKYYF